MLLTIMQMIQEHHFMEIMIMLEYLKKDRKELEMLIEKLMMHFYQHI